MVQRREDRREVDLWEKRATPAPGTALERRRPFHPSSLEVLPDEGHVHDSLRYSADLSLAVIGWSAAETNGNETSTKGKMGPCKRHERRRRHILCRRGRLFLCLCRGHVFTRQIRKQREGGRHASARIANISRTYRPCFPVRRGEKREKIGRARAVAWRSSIMSLVVLGRGGSRSSTAACRGAGCRLWSQ